MLVGTFFVVSRIGDFFCQGHVPLGDTFMVGETFEVLNHHYICMETIVDWAIFTLC